MFTMKRFILYAVMALGVGALTMSARAANPLYDHNLIVNGNAEAGEGLPGAGTTPGWGSGMVSVQYNYDGYPKVSDPGPKHRGTNLFAGGPSAAAATVAVQFIDVSAVAADIDAKTVRYTVSGYLGGYGNQADRAFVQVQFRDASPNLRGPSVNIGPVTVQQRHGVTGLWYRSAAGVVPVGTRQVAIFMQANRSEGATNDGYLDELSFVLHKLKPHK
jgi:hypothetical protein